MNPADLLYEAFWKAGDALDGDDTVHSMEHPYLDQKMDMVDTSGCGMPKQFWGHMAAAVRELLMVRSVEELDALPDDAVVLVDDCPARKHLGDWYFANDDGDGYGSRSLALYLPALVLYRPDWNTP